MSKAGNLAIRIPLAGLGLLILFILLYRWWGFAFLPTPFVDLLVKVSAILALPAGLVVLLVPLRNQISKWPDSGDGGEKRSAVHSGKSAIIGVAMIGMALIVLVIAPFVSAYFSWSVPGFGIWVIVALMWGGLLLIVNSFFSRRRN